MPTQKKFQNIIKEEYRRKLDRPITGVIHKDRIWEQWYTEEAMKSEFPKMSQKDYLFSCIGNDPNRVIINNRGKKTFTVKQFKELVDLYEKAFASYDFPVGSVICTISLTTPEMYAIKYAATSLGLITCNLNVFDVGVTDDKVNRLHRQLANVSPKMIFVLDFLEDKVFSVVNEEAFSDAVKVILPLDNSIPGITKEKIGLSLLNLKKKLNGTSVKTSISLEQFLNKGKNYTGEIKEVYEPGMPCNIAFTSGTTGINKAVLLSHDANNALAFQQSIGSFDFFKGEKHLALVPPFLAFWDADIVHAVFCLGGYQIVELELSYDKIPEYAKKYLPELGVWSQYLWSSILTLPPSDLRSVSENLSHVIVGGERCELNEAEKFFNKTGVLQTTGFGTSEVNTTFSVNHPNCHKVGTAGLPLPFNNVKIVDEAFNDVTYNVPGKLYITGPCLMNEYYKRPDLTEKAIYIDDEGTRWYSTGDYAVMDTDGCLTVLDRYSEPVEIIYNEQAEKVNLLDIVEVIKKNRNVKNIKMTYHNGSTVLHLSVDNLTGLSKEEGLQDIIQTIKSDLPEKHWPDIINVMDQLPRTQVGKVDYPKLQKMGDELTDKNRNCDKITVARN